MSELSRKTAVDRIALLQTKADRLRADLEAVEGDIAALQRAIDIFETPSGSKTRIRRLAITNVSPDELRGLGIEEAAVRIALKNGGVLVSTPARELLVEAGVLTLVQSKYQLWETLKSSKRFEPTGQRGRWRLCEHPPVPKPAVDRAAERARRTLAEALGDHSAEDE